MSSRTSAQGTLGTKFENHMQAHWRKYGCACAAVVALGIIALLVTTFAFSQTKDAMQNMWKTVGKSFHKMNGLGIGLTVAAAIIGLAGLTTITACGGGACAACIL